MSKNSSDGATLLAVLTAAALFMVVILIVFCGLGLLLSS